MGAKYSHGMWESFPHQQTHFRKMCVFVIYLLMFEKIGFCKNHRFFTCVGQSATTKLTVWTVGSYYDFGNKTQCVLICIKNVTNQIPEVDFPLFKLPYN